MGNYWVLERKYVLDLIRDVQKYIALGWEPQGGVIVGDSCFYQTIVRY